MLKEGLAVSLCLPLDGDRTVKGVALWEEVMGSLLSCANWDQVTHRAGDTGFQAES